jgi:hypothetical protein
VVGIALLMSACSSSSTHTGTKSGFQSGPDPCRLVTTQLIFVTLNERMAQTTRSKSSCSYMNRSRTKYVSISTAKSNRAGAEAAVTGTAETVKGRVLHLGGIGDRAIAYLTTTKKLSIGTCLFAKNGTLVFLYAGRPKANHLLSGVIALCKTAASQAH